jgi:hypothetical protein
VAAVQGVRVEEGPAVLGRGRGDHVEQGPLGQVGEARIAGGEQQPPGEQHGGDTGAGLRVGAVRWQDEVVTEGLVAVVRAHPAGQIGPPGDCGLPLPYDGGEQGVVAGLHGHVDGAGREVEGADGVAAQYSGPADGQVVLEVGAAELDVGEGAVAAPVDEQRGLVEIALLPCQPGEFHQGRLDLRVSADARVAARAEEGADVVGGPAGDLHQLALAPGAGLGDTRLDEVPMTVEFVAPFEVAVAGLLTGAAEGGVQIAVRGLGGGDHVGECGDLRIVGTALPRHGFEQLVDLGVGELPAPPVAVDPALGGGPEVAGPALAFHPVAAVSERRGRVGVAAPGPETPGDPHLVEAERAQPAAGRRHRQGG